MASVIRTLFNSASSRMTAYMQFPFWGVHNTAELMPKGYDRNGGV
jgi:hypothetical protein